MKFYNKSPMGESDPLSRTDDTVLYNTSIVVKVYDQDDSVAGNSWRFGDLSVPLWEHTFTSTTDVVYKPSTGDSKRYKAMVIAHQSERKRIDQYSWGSPEQQEPTTAFIEYLQDGGQAVAIEPYEYNRRNLTLTSSVDGAAPSLFAGGGVLYIINSSGNLARYEHDGSGHFLDYNGHVIGWGWSGMKTICAVRDGGLYTISSDGTLRYYHHDASGSWDDINGRKIGAGWGDFPWVGAGRFGQLYAINKSGDLLYYEHDGGFSWKIEAERIGQGWPTHGVFAGGTNCLYIIDSNGDLLYYYHNDSRSWVVQDMKIGNGWGSFTSVASSGNGEIYAVASNGDLLFYRHDVDEQFISGSGRAIGWGWHPDRHGILPSAR